MVPCPLAVPCSSAVPCRAVPCSRAAVQPCVALRGVAWRGEERPCKAVGPFPMHEPSLSAREVAGNLA